MDCFLFPSLFEGLGFVGIEAQAAGLPCFFSDTITREVGITNLAHFYSLHMEPTQWAEKIALSIKSSRLNKREELKNAGYDINYEIEKVQQFYLNG